MKKIDSFQGEYRWLSNFWSSPIEYEGIKYPTVEHAYQAQKFQSNENKRRIAELKTPGEAKREGKEILLPPTWELIKDSIMEDLLRLKFKISELQEKLLITGDVELVEGNTWNDTYWGRCRGIGQNKLGKLLMKIREELKNQ